MSVMEVDGAPLRHSGEPPNTGVATTDRNRPIYPVIFVDCVHVKIHDGQVANRPIYMALAITCDGMREILGLWAGDGGEGAKYWMRVLTATKNRGVGDIRMVVCDGLKGLPEAIEAVWPQAITQTCVVHYPEFAVMPSRSGVCLMA